MSLSELVIVPITASNSTSGVAIMYCVMGDIAESFDSSPKKGAANKIGEVLSVDLPRPRKLRWCEMGATHPHWTCAPFHQSAKMLRAMINF